MCQRNNLLHSNNKNSIVCHFDEYLTIPIPGYSRFKHHQPWRILEHLNLLEGLLVLRFRDDVWLSYHSDAGGSVSGAKMIGGSDGVFPRVEHGRVHNVQSDETKVVVSPESGANGDWAAILEPFDSHRWVAHRFQTALQVDVLSLAHRLRIAQRLHEDRFRFRYLLDVVLGLDEFRLLQTLRLLVGNAVHAARIHAWTSWNYNFEIYSIRNFVNCASQLFRLKRRLSSILIDLAWSRTNL